MNNKLSLSLIEKTVIFLFLLFFFVYLSGGSKKEEGKIESCENIKVYTSERITSCEKNGGKYSLFWSTLSDEYLESCKITEVNIKNF